MLLFGFSFPKTSTQESPSAHSDATVHHLVTDTLAPAPYTERHTTTKKWTVLAITSTVAYATNDSASIEALAAGPSLERASPARSASR
jgi:hypothetical protein